MAWSRIDRIRRAKPPAFKRLRNVAKLVEHELLSQGFFCRTPGEDLYYFHQPDKVLVPVPGPHFDALLECTFCLNPVEVEAKYSVKHLEAVARRAGRQTEVFRLARYDLASRRLYVHNLGGELYRLDGSQIEKLPNGSDGVLFLAEPWYEPFEATPGNDLLVTLLIERVPFDGGKGLSVADLRALFTIWLLSLFFESLLATKPIALFVGGDGAGKSCTLRLTGALLFGSRFNVSGIRADKPDAFDAQLGSEYFVTIDNVDTSVRWLEDKLAVAATGQAIRLRRLYTTNELLTFWPRCFLALTSRNPQFRRSDVADRLLIFPMARPARFSPRLSSLRKSQSDVTFYGGGAFGGVERSRWGSEASSPCPRSGFSVRRLGRPG